MSTPTFFTWPDGSAPMVERFTEQTFVERAELSPEAREYRRPGRAFPRYELSGTFVLFNGERDTLAPLEAGSDVLVPAWMHPLPPEPGFGTPLSRAIHRRGPGRNFLVQAEDGSKRLVTTNVTSLLTLASGWMPGDRVAFPVVKARLSEDGVSVESRTRTIHTATLSFVSDEPQEPVLAQFGSLAEVQFEGSHDWRQAVRTEVSHSANSFDNGNLRTWQLRHTVRGVSVLMTAFGRNGIWALRTFLLNQRGRWKSFMWVDPRDGVERRFRLGSDVLELSYPTDGVMTCAVRLVEVQE